MLFQKLGVNTAALNSETLAANQELWKEVRMGKFNVVLASPEVLLCEGSYFWDNILRN